MTWYRWVICLLLFLAATINYIDRQVIGLLKPTLQQEFGWSEIDYADIVFSFQLAYAIGLLLAGRFIDRIGTRAGFAIAVAVWSIAAMAHAEAAAYGPAAAALLGMAGLVYAPSVAGFIAARFALGIGEAGNFPAAIKVVAEWFPVKERAFATGLFNSGTNIGAVVAPLMVPWITVTYGWYWTFIATGAIGFVWIALWLPLFGQPGTASARQRRRARAHPERSVAADGARAAAGDPPASPDVGVCDRQVHDRSDLVAVSLLGAGFSQSQPRPEPARGRAAAGGDLPDRRRRQHRRRMAVVGADRSAAGR